MTETNTSLVKAQHPNGPKLNGADGCHTRWFNGYCSGQQTAEWLNSLGPDDAPYGNGSHNKTNYQVRRNWIQSSNAHVIWVDASIYSSCPTCVGLGRIVVA